MSKKLLGLPLSTMFFVLCSLLLAPSFPAQAQQPKKIPRIGYLTAAGSSPNQGFLQGLRDLGYVDGQNIVIEFRPQTESLNVIQS
jgi:putative tryptophan/tyrosine transport system substrate-binding protein